ncbi:hypothetical protein GTZ89_49195 [Streptomyces sp. SID8382]|nr:hypothetical protein CFP59_06004 [Streptomyces sp. M56]MYX63361.1 hypothetical protein [Streptomyces sp. SID8382]
MTSWPYRTWTSARGWTPWGRAGWPWTRLAKVAHARVGHRLAPHLPDGTKISPTVVAIYGRGLGIAELTLPRAALIGHVTSSFDSDVLVRGAGGAGPRWACKRAGPRSQSAGRPFAVVSSAR